MCIRDSDKDFHRPPLFAVVVVLHREVADSLVEAYLPGVRHPIAVLGGMGGTMLVRISNLQPARVGILIPPAPESR